MWAAYGQQNGKAIRACVVRIEVQLVRPFRPLELLQKVEGILE
jgi:hypothetical protein